jgi:hypothetical protein
MIFDWTYDLVSPPDRLWPFVSDTNRMNRLAGMGPVTYSEERAPGGGRKRIGSGKLAGLAVRWEERPFSWVYGQRFSVERIFESGPLASYRSEVTLAPTAAGTRLTHRLELMPRIGLTGPLIRMEAGKSESRWSKAYRAVDEAVARGGPLPFHVPSAVSPPSAAATAAAMLVAQGQNRGLVETLVGHVVGTGDLEVQHMRPLELADRWEAQRFELLELFLRASRAGLLEARWHHLCPACRGPAASADTLAGLAPNGHCASCDLPFSPQRDVNVELAFRPARTIRQVSEAMYCVGGPGVTPHVVYKGEIAPRTGLELTLPVEPGTYRLRQGGGEIGLVYAGGDLAIAPATIALGPDGPKPYDGPLAGPQLRLRLENHGASSTPVILERTKWLDTLVTPALLDTLPVFAELVPG